MSAYQILTKHNVKFMMYTHTSYPYKYSYGNGSAIIIIHIECDAWETWANIIYSFPNENS